MKKDIPGTRVITESPVKAAPEQGLQDKEVTFEDVVGGGEAGKASAWGEGAQDRVCVETSIRYFNCSIK